MKQLVTAKLFVAQNCLQPGGSNCGFCANCSHWLLNYTSKLTSHQKMRKISCFPASFLLIFFTRNVLDACFIIHWSIRSIWTISFCHAILFQKEKSNQSMLAWFKKACLGLICKLTLTGVQKAHNKIWKEEAGAIFTVKKIVPFCR